MADSIIRLLEEHEPRFRLFKRKRVGYKFLNFRKGSADLGDLKCAKPPSYFIISSNVDEDEDVVEECKNYCGRVVVCHATGEKSIHSAKDFFQKYTVAESSNTAYPRRELVRAFFPDKAFLHKIGANASFVNFWGRRDEVTEDTVVIKFGPSEYYVKPSSAFRVLYTDDTRDRSSS